MARSLTTPTTRRRTSCLLWVGDVVTPKAVRDDPSMRPHSPVRLFDGGTPSQSERTESEPSEEESSGEDDDGGGLGSECDENEELMDLLSPLRTPRSLPADLRSNSASWSDQDEDDELAAQEGGDPSKKRGGAGSVPGDRTSQRWIHLGAPRRLKKRKQVTCSPPMMRHDEETLTHTNCFLGRLYHLMTIHPRLRKLQVIPTTAKSQNTTSLYCQNRRTDATQTI